MRFAFIIVLCSALLARADEPAAGRWEGSAQIPGQELRLIVDLARDGGAWSGSIIVPGFGVKGAPLKDITLNGSDLSFSIKGALSGQNVEPPKFTARVDANGKMSGEMLQAGNKAPFALEKVGSPQVEAPPGSTAIAKELEGEWKGEYEMLGYSRKVTLKLMNRGADGASADFLIVGKKENHLPVDLITQSGDFVTIESHSFGITYEGRRKGEQLEGTLLQGALETPLTLKRSN